MNKAFLIFLCLTFAKAVLSLQQSYAAVAADLYNQKLKFFDSFLSTHGIDNLLFSTENIPFETIKTLRSAAISYTTLRGEILSWCVEVNNTIESFGQGSNVGEHNRRMSIIKELNQLKQYFDSIATNGVQGNNFEDYQAVITFENGIRKYEVIRGRTPSNIHDLLLPLLEKSKSQVNVTEANTLSTFDDSVNHAKSIIEEVREIISAPTNNVFNRGDIVTKCKPLLDDVFTPRATPQQYMPSQQTITPSPKDILRAYPNNCGGYPGFRKTKCEAILSKSTMEQLLKLYRNDQSVFDFFNAISPLDTPSDCKNRLTSFIRNSYLSWGYEVIKIGNTQSMKISACLDNGARAQVMIVN